MTTTKPSLLLATLGHLAVLCVADHLFPRFRMRNYPRAALTQITASIISPRSKTLPLSRYLKGRRYIQIYGDASFPYLSFNFRIKWSRVSCRAVRCLHGSTPSLVSKRPSERSFCGVPYKGSFSLSCRAKFFKMRVCPNRAYVRCGVSYVFRKTIHFWGNVFSRLDREPCGKAFAFFVC